jgi:unsaturated chondroitin disaccharide hydrolase
MLRFPLVAAVTTAAILVAAVAASAESQLDGAVRQDMVFAADQLHATTTALPDGAYPFLTDSTGAWTTTGPAAWSSGFLAGSHWLQYQQTFEPRWRRQAAMAQAGLESQKTNTSTHDLGFMLLDSFGHGYRLTGDDHYRRILLRAAASLASRYDPQVGCIRSWNTATGFRVIIDNMMNLELLFWAAQHGGKKAWYRMAVSHALRTRENNVRPDGSTYQVVDYDPDTGLVLSRGTNAGYSADSTWSRGQAWAIYGFAIAYRETGDPRFLATARRTASFYLSHLPADHVPYWDFDAPGIPNEPRDSSAAAAAASGLMLLGSLDPDAGRRRADRTAARATIASLSSSYLAAGSANAAVLLHGTYYEPGGDVDSGLIWGDYYFEEALLRYRLLPARSRPLPIRGVRASADRADARKTIDGRLATWWASIGRERSLTYDLGKSRLVGKIGIAFHRGGARSTRIRLRTSVDGSHWKSAGGAVSSGMTGRQETFDFKDREARFVRVVGYGNSLDRWNTISEVRIYP